MTSKWNVRLSHSGLPGVVVEVTCDGTHVHAYDSREETADSAPGELVAFGSKAGRDHVAVMCRSGWSVQS